MKEKYGSGNRVMEVATTWWSIARGRKRRGKREKLIRKKNSSPSLKFDVPMDHIFRKRNYRS